MSDDQEQIAATLADRAAKKLEQLNREAPTVAPVGDGLTVVEAETLTCECGETYTGQRLLNGVNTVRFPRQCASCRAKRETATASRAAEASADRQAELDRRAALSRRQRLVELGIPPLYQQASLDDFEHHGPPADRALQMRALSFARRYIAQFPEVETFVVFRGINGAGKGLVSLGIARPLVEDLGFTARYVKCSALVAELRETWRKDTGVTYRQALKGFTDIDFLLVDEVSTHAFYGQQIHQHLYDVIDTRIEYQRPTILTTNDSDEVLGQILRPALVNRLEGHGGIIEFGNSSWRSRTTEAA